MMIRRAINVYRIKSETSANSLQMSREIKYCIRKLGSLSEGSYSSTLKGIPTVRYLPL